MFLLNALECHVVPTLLIACRAGSLVRVADSVIDTWYVFFDPCTLG